MKNKFLRISLITIISIMLTAQTVNVFAKPSSSSHSSGSHSSSISSKSNSSTVRSGFKSGSFSNSTSKTNKASNATTPKTTAQPKTSTNTTNKNTNVNVNKNVNINHNTTVVHHYNSYGGYSGNFWSNYWFYRAITHTQPVYVNGGYASSPAYSRIGYVIYDVISFIILIAVIIGVVYLIKRFIRNRRRL